MNETRKILGQSLLTGSILTDVYTVPSATQTIVSTFLVCNRASTSTSFRIAVAPSGAADNPAHYIYYDVQIEGNDTFAATIGVALTATDKIRAYSPGNSGSISVFGVEIT